MEAKSCKLVAKDYATKNASNTTNSARLDVDTLVTIR